MRVLFSTVATMIEIRDKYPAGDQHVITNNNAVRSSNMNRVIYLATFTNYNFDTFRTMRF
ncbi:hypothetical protein BFW41_07105 [Aeromonas hydrophila]|nr:hypothetical protein BFW41_07105 [Aeromonas hydrophila]